MEDRQHEALILARHCTGQLRAAGIIEEAVHRRQERTLAAAHAADGLLDPLPVRSGLFPVGHRIEAAGWQLEILRPGQRMPICQAFRNRASRSRASHLLATNSCRI